MADRCAPDLSRMKNLIGKSWNSWNLPEAATEHDLKKMRAQFKPKETKIPLEHTNPLPTELMYLYGSRPEFDWFSLTQCPACKKYYKTQWLNNHFIKNTANEHLCKTTGIVVGTSQVKKKKIPKRSHESRHSHRYRSSHEHHRHRSKKSHHSGSKVKRSSLTYVSEKKHKDRLSPPSKPKTKEKEKAVEDKRYKEKSSSKRHSSPKDRRVSNPTSYTLSIPDDKDENIPVKVLLSNKKANKHERPSLQIISEKPSKISRSVSSEKIKVHKESTEKKSKSSSGSVHSAHKHKKTTSSHSNSDHSPSPTKTNLKDDYKFKIPLKSKSSDSRSQSFDSSSSKSKDSSKYKGHSTEDTPKGKDVPVVPKVAYRSPTNILSNSNIPNKHSSTNSTLSSLKISLQNISPTVKTSSGSESDSSVAAKGISSKSYSKEKSSAGSAVLSPKHTTSSSKGTAPSKSSSTSKSASSNASSKSPSSVTSSKSNVTILNSKLALSLLSPDSKLSSLSKSSSLTVPKQSPPASVSKLSSSKSGASLSRSSSSIKSSSSSSSSASKSSSLSPSKFTNSSSSKSNSKALTIVSPKSSPVSISKSPSSSLTKSSSSTSSSKSTVVSSAKLPVASLPSSKSLSKSQNTSSKSSKSHLPSVKSTLGSNIIMTSSSVKSTSLPSSTLSSSSDSLTSYDTDAPYIRAEIRIPTTPISKSSTEVSGKYLPMVSSKDKKSSKSNSSVVESVSTKQVSSAKDRKHGGKHGSSSSHTSTTVESKSSSSDKPLSSKEKKSSSKSSSVAATSDTKASKTTPTAAAKKSSVYNSSLTSPPNYKALSVSPPHSFPSTPPPAYIAPSWTSAFKSSLAQTLTSAAKSPLPSTIQTSSTYSLPSKNNYPNVVHKSPMIASTSSAIQSTIVTPSTISPTQLGDQLGTKMHQYGSVTFLPTSATVPEVPVQDKSEPKQSHHKKKKKKKDKNNPRKIIPLKDRCFHPDQHCGVVVAPSVMPCKRSLTCKTHSIALRRAVADRSSSFDSLLAAHKKARDEEKLVKSEKREPLTPEAPEKKEVYTPMVDSPVVSVPVAKPIEVPVAAPTLAEPEIESPEEQIPSPDYKENDVPEQGESDSVEADPEVIYIKETPLIVIDSKEVKDGTSLFEISKSKEERLYSMTSPSFKCLSTEQFNKKCQSMKRKIDKMEDCLIISPKKVLVDNENTVNSKKNRINFVDLRLEEYQPKAPCEGSDQNSPQPSKDEEVPTTKSPSSEEEVSILHEVFRKPETSSKSSKEKRQRIERLVGRKSIHRIVRSLRNRHAARRLTAINQALFADNCASHKMYLISKETEMARLALQANDVQRAKRHLTVKKIMTTKDPLSLTARRVTKWLVKSNLGLLQKESMFASSHKLVEKCVLDRKQFLSKQYILIRKQLQNRERVKARKRVLKCYRKAIKRNLLTSKSKFGARQKLATDKQKKLDKQFRLNVYRNLRRIRKHLLRKQLKMLRIALLRRAHYNRQKHLARQIPKRKNPKFPSGKRRVSLVQNRMATRKFLLSEKNSLNRSLARQNYRNIIKPRSDQVASQEKLLVCDVGQKKSLCPQLTHGLSKPRVITVIVPVSKTKVAEMLKSSGKSKNTANPDTNNIQNVNPMEFKKLIESRLVQNNKNNLPGANPNLGVCQAGKNNLHNQLVTARDILALHKNNIAQSEKKKILFGRSCKIDEKDLSVLRQTIANCKTLNSKSECPSLSQGSSAKGQNKSSLEANSNDKSNIDSISTKMSSRKSKTLEMKGLKQKPETNPNSTSRPIGEGNEKEVGNKSLSNSFAASQSGTPTKGKPLGKNISCPNNQNTSPKVISATLKSGGKSTEVGGSQKMVSKPGSLKSEPSQLKLCKYRVVSQNIFQNIDLSSVIPDDNNVDKKGTKVSSSAKKATSITNTEGQNIVTSKSPLKNSKVDSVKKIASEKILAGQGSDGNKSNRQINTKPDSQFLTKNSPNKSGTPAVGRKGSEAIAGNSITQTTEKVIDKSREIKEPRSASYGIGPPLDAALPSNEEKYSQQRQLVTIAVQRLLSQKKLSGDRSFSEQESKLIKLYLRYQSNKSKNTLIANCILAQKSGCKDELYKKVMAGSAMPL